MREVTEREGIENDGWLEEGKGGEDERRRERVEWSEW